MTKAKKLVYKDSVAGVTVTRHLKHPRPNYRERTRSDTQLDCTPDTIRLLQLNKRTLCT